MYPCKHSKQFTIISFIITVNHASRRLATFCSTQEEKNAAILKIFIFHREEGRNEIRCSIFRNMISAYIKYFRRYVFHIRMWTYNQRKPCLCGVSIQY